MEELYFNGECKAIGVCNFKVKRLEQLLKVCRVKPFINQIERHPMFQQKDIVDYCEANGIQIMSYSPVARQNEQLHKNETLKTLSEEYGKSINQIILNLPDVIISTTGSSSWINVIYISIIAIIFCALICKLFKPFNSNDILDVSEYLGGKVLKFIIGIAYFAFFIFISGISLRYLANSIKLIYFEETPIIFLLMFFFFPTVIACKSGIKNIAQVNLMFMPILLISMLIILFATVKDFIPQRIFPILGFGADKTFLVGINNIFAFSGFAYLYFLIPILKNPEQFKKVAFISTIISAIYLFLSVICLLMMFSFISFSEELLSVYLLTRMIEFGRFFQRIDAIFILIWILAMISFLSISSFFSIYVVDKLVRFKNPDELSYCIASFIFVVALSIKNIAQIKFIQDAVFKYVIISLVFVVSFIILILANLKHRKEKSQ